MQNGFVDTDDFTSEDIYTFQEKVQDQDREAIKWKDLPTGVIYKILEVEEVDGNFDKSRILTLKDRQGETSRVWLAPRSIRRKIPCMEPS